MSFLPGKIRWLLLAIVLSGVGLAVVVEFTDWHELEAVTLDGEPVEDWDSQLGLDTGTTLLEQPVERAAATLLDDTAVAKVDISYHLPNRLDIRTNRFTPVCFALDSKTGRMCGLNANGRFVPLGDEKKDWEHPVLTGVEVTGLYRLAGDHRVALLVPELRHLADDNVDLYRLIDEIDMSDHRSVLVTLSGLPYQLRARAEGFHHQITSYIQAVEKYPIRVEDATLIDLRFEDMIIQTGGAK